jgi:glycosyltransferase involved in cell wall biosynthesis
MMRRLIQLRPDVVEINEPFMREGVMYGAAAVLACEYLTRVRRCRVRVVTYAIENLEPAMLSRASSPREWVLGRVHRLLARYVGLHLSRICFGTRGSEVLYSAWLDTIGSRAVRRLIEALPSQCRCLASAPARRASVAFVGAFEERKGVFNLMEAWPRIARSDRQIRLTIAGKGKLMPIVKEFSESWDNVEFVCDPPRSRIHSILSGAAVLVLFSQRVVGWREQIGLPILEGLAHGCTIVTSAETGLSEWLRHNGHTVLSAGAGSAELARAISTAVLQSAEHPVTTGALPGVDGRLAAERWLYAIAHDPRS